MKRKVSHDARYDAVESSSLREELFQTFLKAHGSSSSSSTSAPGKVVTGKRDGTEEDSERQRREKKEQALKEREQKVRAERNRTEAEIGRSKMGLNMEEGEREFRSAAFVSLVQSSRSRRSTRALFSCLALCLRTRCETHRYFYSLLRGSY